MVFLVEDVLFHLSVRRIKQSQFFCDMIDEAHTGVESEGKSDEHPISLGGISAFEMTSFLDALENPFVLGDPNLTFDQWAAALHLATMWSFDDLRRSIITQMDKTIILVNPLDRIDVSLKCRVEKWLHPAYEVLCTRGNGLTEDEVERLGLKRSVAIWRIRESLEFEKTIPIEPSCSGCGAEPFCRNCGRQLFESPPPPPPSTSTPIRKVPKGSRKSSSKPRDTHVLDLIQKEEALMFV